MHDHLHLIARLAAHPAGHEEILAAKRVALDGQVPALTGRYRAKKKELFALIGEIVRENKTLAG